MNFMHCDKCGSEFIIKDAMSSSVRCPDCSMWVDTEPAENYSSRHYGKGYVD